MDINWEGFILACVIFMRFLIPLGILQARNGINLYFTLDDLRYLTLIITLTCYTLWLMTVHT